MKKQEEKKLSHFVCFKCHEMVTLPNLVQPRSQR
jgi:hypothetical protein